MKKIILKRGGKIVTEPTQNTWVIISSEYNSGFSRLPADVVVPQWMKECEEKKTLIPTKLFRIENNVHRILQSNPRGFWHRKLTDEDKEQIQLSDQLSKRIVGRNATNSNDSPSSSNSKIIEENNNNNLQTSSPVKAANLIGALGLQTVDVTVIEEKDRGTNDNTVIITGPQGNVNLHELQQKNS